MHLLGSEPRFVLSTSGHIAALVNPPGNPKASYRVNDDAARGRRTRGSRPPTQTPGTWWEDWTAWLGGALGRTRSTRRKKLGGDGYKPLEDAPGKYVCE